tara:strand:+ start:939 stop:1304 length:366 start_codon:yes stop_codon:yes gene_type:complete
MSLIKGCNGLIDKYNMNETDKIFLLNLYEECKQNYEQNCIDQDALEYYSNISNYIVNYVNDNNLIELKEKLKELFNPLNVDGINTPMDLYTSDELNTIYKNIKKREFEITKTQTDDEPTNP